MTDLPRGITARELLRALYADGFCLTRTRGSHRMFRHSDGRRAVVAYHRSSDTFPIGTLRAMLVDIGWTYDDLRRLDLVR
jgi:predicted RNA binding protein YcfA (HicA-like mRNA interferase family)